MFNLKSTALVAILENGGVRFNLKMALIQNRGKRQFKLKLGLDKIKKWRLFKMAESANLNLKLGFI